MNLNITAADRENETTVARAVLNMSMKRSGGLMRFQKTYSETHRIDFQLDRLSRGEWSPLYYFEVKCRFKKYDPFKISRKKIEEGFEIAQQSNLPFWLWVWFSTESFARGVLIGNLNLPSSGIFHSGRPGNGEASFDFNLNRFTDCAHIHGRYIRSQNSLR